MIYLESNFNSIKKAFKQLSYDDFIDILTCDYIHYFFSHNDVNRVYDYYTFDYVEFFDFLDFLGKDMIYEFYRHNNILEVHLH